MKIGDILQECGAPFQETRYWHASGNATNSIYVHVGVPFKNVFVAHYDIVSGVQVAIDNVPSCAELLSTAITLHTSPYDHDLSVAFLDKEENMQDGPYYESGSYCMAKHELRNTDRNVVLDVCAGGNVVPTRCGAISGGLAIGSM